MRITGSGNLIPPHVARAYGVPEARAIEQPASAQAVSANGPVQSPPISTGLSTSRAAQSLIAGHAPGPITFDGVSIPRANPGVLHLYTRAADKIEAATAIQIGRTLDIKG